MAWTTSLIGPAIDLATRTETETETASATLAPRIA
jgi:hypothetical protein